MGVARWWGVGHCPAVVPPFLRISNKVTNISRAGQLDVLGSDGDTLGVDGTLVGVLEQANQVGLTSFLQYKDVLLNPKRDIIKDSNKMTS